jgi:hypothetical protein
MQQDYRGTGTGPRHMQLNAIAGYALVPNHRRVIAATPSRREI